MRFIRRFLIDGIQVTLLFLLPSLTIYLFDVYFVYNYARSKVYVTISIWVDGEPVKADRVIVMFPMKVWNNTHSVTFEATVGERYMIIVYYQGHMRQVSLGPIERRDYYVPISFPKPQS
ncbi:MAG: hypothetical protein J7L11_07030 [Thermoprotei archaeon]|nr:hypothetical protein [Thermoprotei archaeon]